jgi:hypothetical protein
MKAIPDAATFYSASRLGEYPDPLKMAVRCHCTDPSREIANTTILPPPTD